MKQKCIPLLKIVLTDLYDNTIAVLTNTIDNDGSLNCVLTCSVNKTHSDSIAHLDIELDNNNNSLAGFLNNAAKIQVFVDYEDNRITTDFKKNLLFFMGEQSDNMINEVER